MTLSVLPRAVLPTNRNAGARTIFGTVLVRHENDTEVSTDDGVLFAKLSTSCILSPAAGDRVLVVCQGTEAYVLAVLESHSPNGRLEFPGDLAITAGGQITMQAAELATDVEVAHLGFGTLSLVGRAIATKAKQIRMVAETCDTLATRIYQKAAHFLRRTDELDRIDAKNLDRRAEGLVHLHGSNVITTAEQLTKIDAAQVHVG